METTDFRNTSKQARANTWKCWPVYSLRFGFYNLSVALVVHLASAGFDSYYQQASDLPRVILVQGIAFGIVCGAWFTFLQAAFNTPRRVWRTWILAVAAWATVHVAHISVGSFVSPEIYALFSQTESSAWSQLRA